MHVATEHTQGECGTRYITEAARPRMHSATTQLGQQDDVGGKRRFTEVISVHANAIAADDLEFTHLRMRQTFPADPEGQASGSATADPVAATTTQPRQANGAGPSAMPAAPPPAADPAEPRALSSTAGGKSASSIPVLLARLQREEALLRQALDGKLQVPDGGKKLEETIAKLKRDLTDAGFDPSYATSPAAQESNAPSAGKHPAGPVKLSQALSTELRKALNSGSLRKKIPSSILSGLAALKDEDAMALMAKLSDAHAKHPHDLTTWFATLVSTTVAGTRAAAAPPAPAATGAPATAPPQAQTHAQAPADPSVQAPAQPSVLIPAQGPALAHESMGGRNIREHLREVERQMGWDLARLKQEAAAGGGVNPGVLQQMAGAGASQHLWTVVRHGGLDPLGPFSEAELREIDREQLWRAIGAESDPLVAPAGGGGVDVSMRVSQLWPDLGKGRGGAGTQATEVLEDGEIIEEIDMAGHGSGDARDGGAVAAGSKAGAVTGAGVAGRGGAVSGGFAQAGEEELEPTLPVEEDLTQATLAPVLAPTLAHAGVQGRASDGGLAGSAAGLGGPRPPPGTPGAMSGAARPTVQVLRQLIGGAATEAAGAFAVQGAAGVAGAGGAPADPRLRAGGVRGLPTAVAADGARASTIAQAGVQGVPGSVGLQGLHQEGQGHLSHKGLPVLQSAVGQPSNGVGADKGATLVAVAGHNTSAAVQGGAQGRPGIVIAAGGATVQGGGGALGGAGGAAGGFVVPPPPADSPTPTDPRKHPSAADGRTGGATDVAARAANASAAQPFAWGPTSVLPSKSGDDGHTGHAPPQQPGAQQAPQDAGKRAEGSMPTSPAAVSATGSSQGQARGEGRSAKSDGQGQERGPAMDAERDRERERERDRERGRERERVGGQERWRDRGGSRDRDRDREREKDGERRVSRERGAGKVEVAERDRDRDRGLRSPSYRDRRTGTGSPRDRDGHAIRDRHASRERDREREGRAGSPRERDRHISRERYASRDRHASRERERERERRGESPPRRRAGGAEPGARNGPTDALRAAPRWGGPSSPPPRRPEGRPDGIATGTDDGARRYGTAHASPARNRGRDSPPRHGRRVELLPPPRPAPSRAPPNRGTSPPTHRPPIPAPPPGLAIAVRPGMTAADVYAEEALAEALADAPPPPVAGYYAPGPATEDAPPPPIRASIGVNARAGPPSAPAPVGEAVAGPGQAAAAGAVAAAVPTPQPPPPAISHMDLGLQNLLDLYIKAGQIPPAAIDYNVLTLMAALPKAACTEALMGAAAAGLTNGPEAARWLQDRLNAAAGRTAAAQAPAAATAPARPLQTSQPPHATSAPTRHVPASYQAPPHAQIVRGGPVAPAPASLFPAPTSLPPRTLAPAPVSAPAFMHAPPRMMPSVPAAYDPVAATEAIGSPERQPHGPRPPTMPTRPAPHMPHPTHHRPGDADGDRRLVRPGRYLPEFRERADPRPAPDFRAPAPADPRAVMPGQPPGFRPLPDLGEPERNPIFSNRRRARTSDNGGGQSGSGSDAGRDRDGDRGYDRGGGGHVPGWRDRERQGERGAEGVVGQKRGREGVGEEERGWSRVRR